MFKDSGTALNRLCLAMMAGIGVLSSAILLAALFLLSMSLDHHAAQDGNARLSIALSDWRDTLTATAEDYAIGGTSSDRVNELDLVSLKTDLKAKVDANDSVDWIAVLDAQGKLIHNENLPEDWDTVTYFSRAKFGPVLDEIAQTEPSKIGSVGGAFEAEGVRFLAATTKIMPHALSASDTDLLTYLVVGRNLDASALSKISDKIGGSEVAFSDDTTEQSVSVEGPLGFVGNLTWQAELPGWQFRQAALPWVLGICIAFVLLTSWMAAHFRKMVNSLETMHKVATTDHLTGVANRAALTELLKTPSVQDGLKEGCFAAISLDLDDFKQLNDEYGHHAGDRALKFAAERITQALGPNESVFRMGGDEFLCLMFDPNPKEAADKLVERLNSSFKEPMDLGGFSKVVTPSIGVAIGSCGEHWDVILERSDAAMYRAKRREFTQSVRLG